MDFALLRGFFVSVVASREFRDLQIQGPDRCRKPVECILGGHGPLCGPLLGLLSFFHVVGEHKVGRAQGGHSDPNHAHSRER